jgi:hypothetical protein
VFLYQVMALVLLSFHLRAPTPVDGSYVARTMNGQQLPAELRVSAGVGSFRLFRLEEGVLSLKPGGRFTLHFRYYHQLVRRGAKPVKTPVLSDSESGTYEVRAGSILLVPTKKAGAKARAPITATLVGEEIKASYLLADRTMNERVTLTLRRDASYW